MGRGARRFNWNDWKMGYLLGSVVGKGKRGVEWEMLGGRYRLLGEGGEG